MIKELHLQNFKRFRDNLFQFRPSGVTLLAGGNNCGKSTVLQALAVWEFCRTVVESEKGRCALEGQYTGSGIPVSSHNFSPIALPSFEHLWTNLNPKFGREKGQPNASYTLRILCKWDDLDANNSLVERCLSFGLTVAHDRIYVKPLESTVPTGGMIPRCAYLPPFAGITGREERLSQGSQHRLIGRGLAGAALRNILFDLHRDNFAALETALAGRKQLSGQERKDFYQKDPWHQLGDVLQRVFQCGLRVERFDESYHTTVGVLFRRLQKGTSKPIPNYSPRDIMVEGSGFLQWLSVYALAVRRDIQVLLLDEPDAHLHPSLQSHLLDRLRSLARENDKQVLMATHSTEILRRVEPSDIFSLSDRGRRYLSADSHRIALFEGIGSDYCPRLDNLRQHKRVVFYEGPSDEEFVRIVAERYGKPLPRNLVSWQYSGTHSQRGILFEQLSQEITELKGLSLRDRDSLELNAVGADLKERGQPGTRGELRCRTWRRRHFENYILVPTAIARASGKPLTEVKDFLQTVWGIPTGDGVDLMASDCSPGLLDARAKEALYEGLPARGTEAAKPSVERQFNCTRYDIARNLAPEEIAADVKTLIDEIHALCAS